MNQRETKTLLAPVLVIVTIILFISLYYFLEHTVFYVLSIFLLIAVLLVLLVNRKKEKIREQGEREKQLADFNHRLQVQVELNTAAIRDVFERVTDAFVAVNGQWQYTYLNRRAEELLSPGQPRGYLAGKNIFSVIPEAEGSPFHRMAKEAMERQEYRYVEDFDPRYERWYENHIYPSGEGLSVFFRDISYRKKAEEALQISEKKYRMLIEQASEAVFVFGQDMQCVDVNPGASVLTGYSREELLQLKVTHLVCPEDIEKTPPRMEELKTGKMVTTIRMMRRKDGSVYYGESVARLMPDGRIVSFVRDITERKKAELKLQESEERYRIVIEQAADAIMLTDQSGHFLEVNESFCRLIGYTREEIIGTHLESLVDPDHLRDNPIRIDLLMAGEVISRERKVVAKNGALLDVEIKSKMLADGRLLAIIRDITARKKAEEALRRSENDYNALVNNIDGIVWEADAQTFEFIFVSQQAVRFLGYPVQNWIDDPEFWASHIHPDDRSYAVGYCQRSTLAMEPHTFEYRMITSEGKIIWIRDIVSVVVENDRPVRLRGLMIDITEQKLADIHLREAEDKFRRLVEQSLVGVYIIQDGKYAYVNPKIAELYGYTVQEITGQPVGMLADEEEMITVNENIRRRLTGEKNSIQYEITGKRKDGSYINVEVYGSRTIYRGSPAIIGTLIDITERKKAAEVLRRSEEKYKLLFERSPLPMFMYHTPAYGIIDVNTAAILHYGYSEEEFRQMNVRDLRPPEDIPHFLEKATETANGNMGIWRHVKKDGTIIRVEIIAHDISYQGRPARLAVAKDITEQLKAEEQLQQSYEEIRMLASHIEQVREEEKIKIAREIHDELGQMITSLKIDVSWLSRRAVMKDVEIQKKISAIMDMLDETVKTIRRIATELRPGMLDNLGLVAAMEWQSREFEKRSEIKTLFRSNYEEICLPDNLATGLFRIFQESLTNVARHAQATLVTASLDKNGEEIVLKIQDNGIGFDVSAISYKRTLGLLGMKERAMMIGGNYELISKKGEGTTVVTRVRIPSGARTQPA